MPTVAGISAKTYEKVKKETDISRRCMCADIDPCVRRYDGLHDGFGRRDEYRNGRKSQH